MHPCEEKKDGCKELLTLPRKSTGFCTYHQIKFKFILTRLDAVMATDHVQVLKEYLTNVSFVILKVMSP